MTYERWMRTPMTGDMVRQRYSGIQDKDVMDEVKVWMCTMPGRLKRLRKASGFTLQEVADMVGYSRETLRGIENGAFAPSVVGLLILASFYGAGLDWLFGLEEEDAF